METVYSIGAFLIVEIIKYNNDTHLQTGFPPSSTHSVSAFIHGLIEVYTSQASLTENVVRAECQLAMLF